MTIFNGQSDPTQLTLCRKKQYMEGNIPIDILVNGYLACQLKSGEIKTISVFSQDVIELQADMMKNRTKALEVNKADREELIFEVSHVISNAVYFIGMALAIISTILIFATHEIAYTAIVAPPAALLLYFKFIKRDRYLKISKIQKSESLYKPSEN